MTVGPIQAFVIGFPDNELFEGRIADELARLSDVGQIRIIDAVFVMRDGDDVSILSASDLNDTQRAELRAAVAALIGLGVAGDEGACSAPHSVHPSMLMLRPQPRRWRNGWSTTSPTAARHSSWRSSTSGRFHWGRDPGAGGVVIAHHSITIEDLILLGMTLADEAELGRQDPQRGLIPCDADRRDRGRCGVASSDLRLTIGRISRVLLWVVYVWVVLNLVLLFLAFVLQLFGANPEAGFTQWVYRSVERSMAPFRGIFEPITLSDQSVLDTSLLFAMIVYGLVALFLRAGIDWVSELIERAADASSRRFGTTGSGDVGRRLDE